MVFFKHRIIFSLSLWCSPGMGRFFIIGSSISTITMNGRSLTNGRGLGCSLMTNDWHCSVALNGFPVRSDSFLQMVIGAARRTTEASLFFFFLTDCLIHYCQEIHSIYCSFISLYTYDSSVPCPFTGTYRCLPNLTCANWHALSIYKEKGIHQFQCTCANMSAVWEQFMNLM